MLLNSVSTLTRPVIVMVVIGLLSLAVVSLVQAAPEILGVFNFPCNTGGRCVEVTNNGSGIGVFGHTKTGTNGAVRGVSPDSNLFGVGVSGKANFAGVKGESVNGWGMWGLSTNGIGVYGHTVNGMAAVRGDAPNQGGTGVVGEGEVNGVRGESQYGVGVRGESTTGMGIRGVSESSVGVRGDSASGIGVRGASADHFGVVGHSSGSYGVYGVSTGSDINDYGGVFISNHRGLFADGAIGNADGTFPNCIRVGGMLYGNCASAAPYSAGVSILAVNGGSETLMPGDVLVFKGMGTVAGVPDVVVLVDRAAGVPGEAVLGVMKESYALEPSGDIASGPAPADDLPPLPEDSSDRGRVVEGNAEPGGLLFVQIDGIARVNVDAAGGPIVVGSGLLAAAGGRAGAAPAEAAGLAVLGRALESLPGGSGAIYVLLGVR